MGCINILLPVNFLVFFSVLLAFYLRLLSLPVCTALLVSQLR